MLLCSKRTTACSALVISILHFQGSKLESAHGKKKHVFLSQVAVEHVALCQ